MKRVSILAALAAAAALAIGCSSKQETAKTEEAPATSTEVAQEAPAADVAQEAPSADDAQTSTEVTQETTYGKAVDAAKAVDETKAALAKLANPEYGIDPVCKMAIDGSYTAEINGKVYGFCSETCANEARAHPEKYLMVATLGQ